LTAEVSEPAPASERAAPTAAAAEAIAAAAAAEGRAAAEARALPAGVGGAETIAGGVRVGAIVAGRSAHAEQTVQHRGHVLRLSVADGIEEERFLGRRVGVELVEHLVDDLQRVGRSGHDDGIGARIRRCGHATGAGLLFLLGSLLGAATGAETAAAAAERATAAAARATHVGTEHAERGLHPPCGPVCSGGLKMSVISFAAAACIGKFQLPHADRVFGRVALVEARDDLDGATDVGRRVGDDDRVARRVAREIRVGADQRLKIGLELHRIDAAQRDHLRDELIGLRDLRRVGAEVDRDRRLLGAIARGDLQRATHLNGGKPLVFRTVLSSATASAGVTGCLLSTVTRPVTGTSFTITKPATSERYSRPHPLRRP
jgi:hypothetical protein